MEKVVKFSNTIRNNWKKSVCGVIALYYGATTVKEKYEINILMRAACKEALQYGDSLIPMDRNPTVITVILNPMANKRKAKQEYEKYCEPLFHLAGLQVDVVQTTSEGHAKELVETLRGTEAIIVAGGDGTLSETVTGLLRRNDDANQFPVGILPLGQSNCIGNSLFPGGKGVDKVKQLIEASMAVIKGNTEWKDAMKIEPITEEDTPARPIYALSSIEWGAFRDTMAKRDKYWIYGPLRDYAAFIFNGYKDSLTWDCKGTIKFTPPCEGCNNCVIKKREVPKKWFFYSANAQSPPLAVQKSDNPQCKTLQELCFKTSDFKIKTQNLEGYTGPPALHILLGKNGYSYTEFVSEGWRRLRSKEDDAKVIHVRTVELLPRVTDDEVKIEIDKEDFEVKPVKVTLLPKVVKLFVSPKQISY